MAHLSVLIYSDIICPWCFIGRAHLQTALEMLDPAITVDITWSAFMLNPDCPPGGVELATMLRQKYGADPSAMFARVVAAGRAAGVTIDYARQPRAYRTAAAHTLIRHAASLGTQDALARALHEAYFTQGVVIDDPQALEQIAVQHGFAPGQGAALAEDAAELAQTHQLASAAPGRGVRGVPFFVFNNCLAVSGAQPPEVLHEAMQKALEAS